MNFNYPTGALTKMAQAMFGGPDKKSMLDEYKTKAYVMAAAANSERNRAAADEYRQKAAERAMRNQSRTPEALQNTVAAGMGLSPASDMANLLSQAFTTGQNPMTPGQPAVELPTMGAQPLVTEDYGQMNLGAALQPGIETLAPAVAPAEIPLDRAMQAEYARRMGDFGAMNAATGDTNYQQLQAGMGQRMENDALGQVMAGGNIPAAAMAMLKASPLFDNSGNRYTGEDSEFTRNLESGRMGRERIKSDDRRYNTDTDAATSRRNADVSQDTERWKHTTQGANKGAKAQADETAAINGIDVSLPIVPQVSKSDPDYQQFYRIYTNAKNSGDLRTLRALLHKAKKHGLIRQGE